MADHECRDCDFTTDDDREYRSHRRKHQRDRQKDEEVSDEEPEEEVSEGPAPFEAPQPARKRGRPKGSTRKAPARPSRAVPPMRQQLEVPYKLGAELLKVRGLPHTANAVFQQTGMCAAAWDDFLAQFPSLYEALEKGLVFGSVGALILAHYPIFQAARWETQAIREYQARMAGDGASANAV